MVIAYLRVSTNKQHLENQKSEIERYAKNKNIKIDSWSTETVSGKTKSKSRKLGNLLKKMKSGDTLIVTEISRLSRTINEVMNILSYCVENKINIYSTKDGYTFDDSLNSKVLAFAFGLVAEIEHKLISQRTKEALALRKAAGQTLGRKKGDCYKLNYTLSYKTEIRKMIEEGQSTSSICKKLSISKSTFYRARKFL